MRPAVCLLFVADTLFVWMYLAADPLDQVASTRSITCGGPAACEAALRFAADWRHGMAGNSPLYMPGFFLLAIGAWVWAGSTTGLGLLVERTASIAAAVITALAATAAGVGSVLDLYAASHPGFVLGIAGSGPTVSASFAAAYTAITWSVLVGGCRLALVRRSWWPLAPAPGFVLGLAFARVWTVDHVTALWWSRAVAGDAVAISSLLAIPVTATVLLIHHRWTSPHPHARQLPAHGREGTGPAHEHDQHCDNGSVEPRRRPVVR